MASGDNNDILLNSEEFSTLDALLAEVDDTVVKSHEPQFYSNRLNKINDDNVENFLLCKFNQYSGKPNDSLSIVSDDIEKDVNNAIQLVKHTTNISNEKDGINKITNGCKYKEAILNEYDNKQVYTDPIFGLRIINPQISSVLLTERMAGRKLVKFDELPRHLEVKTASDWVIAGVLLTKEVKCSSKNSSRFTIWKLSDLQGNMKAITIFLFQNAHNELWKTSAGTCVAILNPSFIEKKSYTQDIANLSIESAKKVLILGKSKDFGVCKAKTKNGNLCTNFINLQESDFCVFHIQKEFKKVARPFAKEKINLNGYRTNQNASNKSAHLGTSNLLQKDKLRLESLNNPNNIKISGNISSNAYTVKSNVPSVPPKSYNYGSASKVDADGKQRKTDLERVKSLYSSMNSSNIFSLPEGAIKFKDFSAGVYKYRSTSRSSSITFDIIYSDSSSSSSSPLPNSHIACSSFSCFSTFN
ncbi:protein MCM10 homolog isoform X2 [Zeugodacus cucurbitae]|uniref:Protein MCM10 homolog n=1 Tax=Zeugodacus cucurbitae TaxID=28588 RepID=A0A0A1WIQ0_ZEUCU|nr:protein MCM10 homolog isoform X2 [Zeugodacus cucurbitae]